MKKILLLIVLIICPMVVNAEADFYQESYIKDNGDILVKQGIILYGDYNGADLKVLYKYFDENQIYSADSFELIKVCESSLYVEDILNNPENCFDRVNYARAGDSRVYTYTESSNSASLRMYNPSYNGSKAFYIEYILKNVIVKHNDIAELKLNVIDDSSLESFNNFDVRFYLPGEDSNARIWGHGPLTGDSRLEDNKVAIFTVRNLSSETAVDVRIAFNKNLVPNSIKTTNKDMLNTIIEEETKLADKANEEREKAQKIEQFKVVVVYSLSFVWFVGLIILLIRMYKKYDKEYKSDFNEKYYRDFPGDYSPEIVQYLMEKKVDTKGLSASLLNIIRKKGFVVEEKSMQKGIIFKKEEKDYLLIKSEEKEPLTESENSLRNWLLMYYGDNNEFAISSMKNKIKNEAEARAFMKKYNEWAYGAKKEAIKEEFYEDHTSKKILPIFYGLLPIILLVFGLTILTDWIFILIILSIIGLIFSIYIGVMNKRTNKGNEHYMKWKALKNFLNDFGNFKDKELPEIHLWEKYLVYATVFGIAEKLKKDMEIKLQSIPDSNVHINTFNYLYLNHAINRAVTHSVVSAFSAATKEIASSSRSSGGGFGGGWSGGGGFSGGGGSSVGRF